MATFGKATYNAAKYASIRPTYPRQLYDFIFQYHEKGTRPRWGTAVDLGCGTGTPFLIRVLPDVIVSNLQRRQIAGQATIELTPFQRIIGVDPSAKMIEQANKNVSAAGLPGQLEYRQSAAEQLSFLEDSSVDLIASGMQQYRRTSPKL